MENLKELIDEVKKNAKCIDIQLIMTQTNEELFKKNMPEEYKKYKKDIMIIPESYLFEESNNIYIIPKNYMDPDSYININTYDEDWT